MNFIKDESGRIIDKLYNATSNNLKNLNINEQISTVNPFIFSNINVVEETKSNIKEYTKEKSKENRQNLKLISEDIDKIINSKLGLTNLGQTCYMNSSLQILIHNEIFLNQISLIKINPFMNEILNEFLEILFAILNYKYNEDNNYLINSYSPIKFKNYFIENHQNFKEGQQDAIEFLRVLLDNISMETNRNKVKVEYKELNLEDKSKKIQNDEYHKYYLS